MIVFSVGCVLIVISLVLLFISYRMYSYRELLQSGMVPVRVLTSDKKYYGWVVKSSIIALDRINYDKYQWFIELYSSKKFVIKIESIQEIKLLKSPFEIAFKSPGIKIINSLRY